DRMAMRSLGEIVRGVDDGDSQKRETAYYKHGAALRELVHRRGPTLFDGGSAFIMGGGGRLVRVKLREAGKPERTVKDLPTGEFAVGGSSRDVARALGFGGGAWSALAPRVVGGMGLRVQPAPAALAPAPALLAGTSAYWLDMGWLEQFARTTV